MTELKDMTPEELLGEAIGLLPVPNCEIYNEILSEMKAYRSIKAKAEEIRMLAANEVDKTAITNARYFAAREILAAATPAESEGK